MAIKAERKEHPISMRLPEADIAMIDRAAGLRGRSRTDFVRRSGGRARSRRGSDGKPADPHERGRFCRLHGGSRSAGGSRP